MDAKDTKTDNSAVADVTRSMSELTVLSFRNIDDLKRLSKHLNKVLNDPLTKEKTTVYNYMKNLLETHKKIIAQKRELVEVEYIFTTEKKSSLQRQRFNSLPISEVPELLKAELLTAANAQQVHICTDCDVAIDLNDEEPLMESLQKHFNLEVHLPKFKRESIDVSEPIILPKMSRRLSAMECGETPAQSIEQVIQAIKPVTENLVKGFLPKLETSLIRYLPDKSEASVDAALKFYQDAHSKLCQEVSNTDFSLLTNSVAPIIMSIKDNVNQNFSVDANKNVENEDCEPSPDKLVRNQVKKLRYYGPIENMILNLLTNHKLISLVDDRTGKLAFFCMSCEYYTLRFRYDSVLSHVFNDTHVHNLSCILQADNYIPFPHNERSTNKIKEMNRNFLISNGIIEDVVDVKCGLCKVSLDSVEASVVHVLDENHLAKLSDKLYRKARNENGDSFDVSEWGQKCLEWTKFLTLAGKPLNVRDQVVYENFIKPSGKVTNLCSCCDITLKGPRQVVFNHIRQKKHLRNAAPHKLSLLYKNHCRPAEYFGSFGNFYVCAICPKYVAMPSFAAIMDHIESDIHVETIAKVVLSALYSDRIERELLTLNKIDTDGHFRCEYCDLKFENISETIMHILSSVRHQDAVAESKTKSNKGDVISVYMQGNYVLHSEGTSFNCVPCKGVFNSIRSLLFHLVYAKHFTVKPTSENVFRFYLELKHNIGMMVRNKYVYYEFGKLRCGVCDADVAEEENAKRHVLSLRHKERMGTTYVNNAEMTAAE